MRCNAASRIRHQIYNLCSIGPHILVATDFNLQLSTFGAEMGVDFGTFEKLLAGG
jgi:hypothetical protein